MKISVDVRMFSSGGIGTYLRNLLPHLELYHLNMNAPIYSMREQIEYSLRIPPCELFWSPHFNVPIGSIRAKKRVVTIHDLFHLDRPFPWLKKAYAKFLLQTAIKNSEQIITVSAFSKERILHHFPQAKEKITVIYSGADHLHSIKPKPFSTPSSFFLAIGSKKKHKNLSLLRGKIPDLVIVDQGNLPLENLCWLYKNAKALIFPSLYEGWGFPPLEAMSLGCPVIASNAASIPEACGDAALYFDPYCFDDLQRALNNLEKQREDLIEKGLQRASQFTWWRAAHEHEKVFARILSL